MEGQYYLGIDIGGTNTKFGLIDESAKILYRGSVRTTDFSEPEGLLEFINNEVKPFLKEVTLTGVGIGACSIVPL